MRASRLRLNFAVTPCGIVVGLLQNLRVLHQIDADDEGRAAAEDAAGVAQERRRLVRLEIADGRAREKPDPRHDLRGVGQFERLGEVGRDRQHRELGIFAAQLRHLLLQELRRNLDRHIGRERLARADSTIRVLVLEPLPNSTSAAPGGISAAMSPACSLRMPISQRVG